MGGHGTARVRQPPLLPKRLAAVGAAEDRGNARSRRPHVIVRGASCGATSGRARCSARMRRRASASSQISQALIPGNLLLSEVRIFCPSSVTGANPVQSRSHIKRNSAGRIVSDAKSDLTSRLRFRRPRKHSSIWPSQPKNHRKDRNAPCSIEFDSRSRAGRTRIRGRAAWLDQRRDRK